MDVKQTFEKSVEHAKKSKTEMQPGFCCECGGIMKSTGNQFLCLVKDKGFVDKFELQCDKCSKKDFYRVEVKHLNEKEDNQMSEHQAF